MEDSQMAKDRGRKSQKEVKKPATNPKGNMNRFHDNGFVVVKKANKK
jgi:hypothetical protein